MTPFFFGRGRRRLFGLYEPPLDAGAGTRAVLLCQSWGAEYIHAHRAVRHLAKLLSEAGFHALRFDYQGTGDSAGEAEDAAVAAWEDDVAQAIEELEAMSGTPRLSLVGMRIGANLAAAVAARRPASVGQLVLWDPVLNGNDYVAELHARAHARLSGVPLLHPRPAASGGGYEVLGHPMTAALEREFRALDLTAMVPALPARTHVILTVPQPGHDTLIDLLSQRCIQVTVDYATVLPPWVERYPDGDIPIDTLQRVVQWMA